MTIRKDGRLLAIHDVPWASLHGAYGASEGEWAIPPALSALREGPDDGDSFDEGMSVLYSHVWHQGSLYPVTSRLLPFVCEILDEVVASDTASAFEELAQFVPLCASSARLASQAKDAVERACAADVLAALRAEEDRLLAWTRTPFRAEAIATRLNVPPLDDRLLQQGPELAIPPRDLLLVVLETLGRGAIAFDAKVLRWAAATLDAFHDEVASAAAKMLREAADDDSPPSAPPKLAALAAALARGDSFDAVSALFFPLRIAKNARDVARRSPSAPQSVVPVLVKTRAGFVVDAPERCFVRWPNAPFDVGESVIVIARGNVITEARGTGQKAGERMAFDRHGQPIVDPDLGGI